MSWSNIAVIRFLIYYIWVFQLISVLPLIFLTILCLTWPYFLFCVNFTPSFIFHSLVQDILRLKVEWRYKNGNKKTVKRGHTLARQWHYNIHSHEVFSNILCRNPFWNDLSFTNNDDRIIFWIIWFHFAYFIPVHVYVC